LQPFFRSADILAGSFSGGGNTQLLLAGPQGILIGEFEKIRDACSGSVVQASFKILLKSTVNPFSSAIHLIAADLDGNKITEILALSKDGSFKVARFDKGKKEPWMILASGSSNLLKPWGSGQNEFKITPGPFLQRYTQDLLLIVSGNKSMPCCNWSILRYDPANHSFIPCFSEKQNHLGKTIGLDTLKPSDEIFTGAFDNSGKIKVFRYNRDWRFDLKEIRFNDSTFQVIANIDFKGYEKDHNPKYYEILRLVPVNLITPGRTSFLVIGRNCKNKDPKEKECREFIDLQVLPGTIQVYSLRKSEK
jgi:hypothetical protein